MTIWTVLALSVKDLPNEAAVANRDKARKWLAENPRGESHQSQIARLLIDQHFETPRNELQPAIDRLLKLQNEDGGWSQIAERGSDAYATGQTLFVLGRSGENAANNSAVAKGQAWLIGKQQADGNWNMAPRPNKPGDKESENVGPITYVGTAWATLGLIRTTAPAEPAAQADVK
jgi:squalene cyclase